MSTEFVHSKRNLIGKEINQDLQKEAVRMFKNLGGCAGPIPRKTAEEMFVGKNFEKASSCDITCWTNLDNFATFEVDRGVQFRIWAGKRVDSHTGDIFIGVWITAGDDPTDSAFHFIGYFFKPEEKKGTFTTGILGIKYRLDYCDYSEGD